ncbi:MAG: aryl-sulfate sulfotransferase [Bacteroidota bacterium]
MKRIFYALLLLLPSSLLAQDQTVGLFLNDSTALNGYTLFSVNRTTYLIDNCGYEVHRWNGSSNVGLSTYLLEDGRLLRTGSVLGDIQGAGSGGRIELLSWTSERLWTFDYNDSEVRQHHDIEALPNGNILILAWEVYSREEALAAGRDPELLELDFWPDHIIEVEPVGTDDARIVWEWRAWDHLIQDFDPTKANYGDVGAHPELIDINLAQVRPTNFPGVTGEDWMHGNSIDYHPERDEIVISVRNFSELLVIDHSTTTEEAAGHRGGNSDMGGDLLYRWGNPMNYRRGDSTDQVFFQQHDARWIPPGYPHAGQIQVFNNGKGRSPQEFSTVERIDPPLDGEGRYQLVEGKAYGPVLPSRTYRGSTPFFSSFMGGAQPLSNGNTLVCVSQRGGFMEVNPEDSVVWRYVSPVGINGPVAQGTFIGTHNIFRATRYPEDYPAFIGRELLAGAPLERDPIPLDCTIYSDPSVGTTERWEAAASFRVAKNPFGSFLAVEGLPEEAAWLRVYDVLGRRYRSERVAGGSRRWDSSAWPSGWYWVQLRSEDGRQQVVHPVVKQ